MSKNKHDEGVTYFFGACDKCAETYQAHSATDNLEGITFTCKKMFCSGTVTLQMDELGSHVKEIDSPFDLEPESGRYC